MATEQTINAVSSGTVPQSYNITLPFVNATDLEVYIGKGKIESIEVTNAGAGYSNITFTGSAGAGNTTNSVPLVFSGGGPGVVAPTVRATVTDNQIDSKFWTDANGTEFTGSGGSNYVTSPNISISGLTGGTGGELTAKIFAKKALTTDYTISGTTLTFSGYTVVNSDKIRIKRVTNVTSAANVFTSGSAITAADLNKSFNQIRYKTEELPNVTSTAVTDGDKGDITVSGTEWSLDTNAVTTAKIADNAVNGDKLADDITIAGNLTVTLPATFNHNVTLGNAHADAIVFTGSVNSNILPHTDGARDLGSSSYEWRDLYIDGTANIDSLVADTADINAGTIDNTIIGDSTPAKTTVTTLDATGACNFNDTTDAGSSTSGGSVTIDGGLAVALKAFIGGDFSVNNNKVTMAAATGNTAIAGTLAVSGNTSVAAGKSLTANGPLILGKAETQLEAGANTFAVTHTWHEIQSEGSDTSDTILGATGGTAGQILILTAKAGHTITLDDGGDSSIAADRFRLRADNILVGNSADVTILMFNGTHWLQIAYEVGN
jgi:hypothetical protein